MAALTYADLHFAAASSSTTTATTNKNKVGLGNFETLARDARLTERGLAHRLATLRPAALLLKSSSAREKARREVGDEVWGAIVALGAGLGLEAHTTLHPALASWDLDASAVTPHLACSACIAKGRKCEWMRKRWSNMSAQGYEPCRQCFVAARVLGESGTCDRPWVEFAQKPAMKEEEAPISNNEHDGAASLATVFNHAMDQNEQVREAPLSKDQDMDVDVAVSSPLAQAECPSTVTKTPKRTYTSRARAVRDLSPLSDAPTKRITPSLFSQFTTLYTTSLSSGSQMISYSMLDRSVTFSAPPPALCKEMTALIARMESGKEREKTQRWLRAKFVCSTTKDVLAAGSTAHGETLVPEISLETSGHAFYTYRALVVQLHTGTKKKMTRNTPVHVEDWDLVASPSERRCAACEEADDACELAYKTAHLLWDEPEARCRHCILENLDCLAPDLDEHAQLVLGNTIWASLLPTLTVGEWIMDFDVRAVEKSKRCTTCEQLGVQCELVGKAKSRFCRACFFANTAECRVGLCKPAVRLEAWADVYPAETGEVSLEAYVDEHRPMKKRKRSLSATATSSQLAALLAALPASSPSAPVVWRPPPTTPSELTTFLIANPALVKDVPVHIYRDLLFPPSGASSSGGYAFPLGPYVYDFGLEMTERTSACMLCKNLNVKCVSMGNNAKYCRTCFFHNNGRCVGRCVRPAGYPEPLEGNVEQSSACRLLDRLERELERKDAELMRRDEEVRYLRATTAPDTLQQDLISSQIHLASARQELIAAREEAAEIKAERDAAVRRADEMERRLDVIRNLVANV